ncbi:cation:proton antiporter [Lichenibacterium dinghuense]|uniref:cation:proton antiporter n=1 Tax=Lichenibacterium dinghuense TaxID=2895977 RepID=UPI001F29BD60|nr:sodium:proton antiporter [Lichenibacterium sp. 6Y81]
MPSIYDLAALLLVVSAAFGWLNHRYSPLPHTMGLLLAGLLASLALIAVDLVIPDRRLFDPLTDALLQIDFHDVVMNGMLGFLLFAGALHIDLDLLRQRALPVVALACLGTAISTAVVGAGFWASAALVGHPIGIYWCMAFGALISPTDPVAVMSALKAVKVPQALEAQLQGESLFNDGVGIVLFTVMLRFAAGDDGHGTTPLGIVELLLAEAGGGLLLGTVTGYLAYRAMRAIDDFAIEVLISLALVMGTYALAGRLHASGPLSVVAAGLLIADRGPRYAMTERTQTYLFGLWTLIDEVLNSLLFLLIGLEVLVLRHERPAVSLAVLAVPLVLLGRLAAVAGSPLLFGWRGAVSAANVPFLTWAGVRGGISVALALSMPDDPAKPTLLAATYAVVLFSVVMQGGTLGPVVRRTVTAG